MLDSLAFWNTEHKNLWKLGGEVAKKSASLTKEVKHLKKKLEEKLEVETNAAETEEGETIQKLNQELKNTKDLLKLRDMEIKILKN